MATSIGHKLFKKIDGRSIELICFISGGLVSAAVVYFESNQKPTILATDSQQVDFSYNPQPEDLKKKTYEALDKMFARMVGDTDMLYGVRDIFNGQQHIHHINVYVSDLWAETRGAQITKRYPEPQVMSQDLLNSLFAEHEDQEGVIENKIMFADANGYSIEPSELLGHESSSFTIDYLTTTLEGQEQDELYRAITEHFMIDEKYFTIAPISSVLLNAISQSHTTEDTYTLVFFDAEDSDWFMIKKGEYNRHIHRGYGRAEIKRQMIKAGIEPDFMHAQSALRRFFLGESEKNHSEKIDNLLLVEADVVSGLVDFEFEGPFPAPAYVISSNAGVSFLNTYVLPEIGIKSKSIFDQERLFAYMQLATPDLAPSAEIAASIMYREQTRD